jgi:hypothetical protein
MSESDKRIVQAAITECARAGRNCHRGNSLVGSGKVVRLQVRTPLVDSLTKDIAKAFAAKDGEITRLRASLEQAKWGCGEWWAQARMFAQKLAQFAWAFEPRTLQS